MCAVNSDVVVTFLETVVVSLLNLFWYRFVSYQLAYCLAVQYINKRAKITNPLPLPVLQIMHVKMRSGQAEKVEEVYSNDGTDISASASVVVYERTDTMLIGTILTDAYYCKPQ